MCPSYLRIRLPKGDAMRRFAQWLALPELEPPVEVPAGQATDLSVEDGQWRGIALFIAEKQSWTVFEDMTGYLARTPIEKWLRLAGNDELVFAGYNDAIWWSELIVLQNGQVVREFREAEEAPEENVDRGRLAFEADAPLRRWFDVAGFVDEDELGYGLDHGCLWQFQRRAGR
jgi:hypothetical protein